MKPVLKKFKRNDFKREPVVVKLPQAQLEAMPGYAEVKAVFTAPCDASVAPVFYYPANPTDGTGYVNYDALPLFSGTASIHDIHQGVVADCYFLAALASMAAVMPTACPLMVVKQIANSNRARYWRGGGDQWVYTTSDLPNNADNIWDNSTWVPIYEKTYCFERNGANTYSSLNIGNQGTALRDLGFTVMDYPPGPAAWTAAAIALSNNLPVALLTTSTMPAGIPMIADHCHTVTGVIPDGTVILYNPWGIDGAGTDSDPNDGTVTSTQTILNPGIVQISVATGFVAPTAIPTGGTVITVNPTGTTVITADQFSSMNGCGLEKQSTVNFSDIGAQGSNVGSFVEWTVSVAVAGIYSMVAQVAAPGSAVINVTVNAGPIQGMQVIGTGGWDKFAAMSPVPLQLTAGNNTICLTNASTKAGVGNYNVGPLTLTAPTAPPAKTITSITINYSDGTSEVKP